ncbi:MAG: SDR family oxidoreductase [Chthonomonadales bacterium]|nr:SDR family oxidoreductase [Chthonomonadales bacterium]
MKTVLVTGSSGFMGRNLTVALSRRDDLEVIGYDVDTGGDLAELVGRADVIYHLAGINRPPDPSEYARGNAGLTAEVCDLAAARSVPPMIVLSSSIQAELDNPYGASKRAAEDAVRAYAERTGAVGVAFRLPNVFGKWSRPNYNSAVATFCHNIARDLPITVSDPDREMQLVYIDDVVAAFITLLDDFTPSPLTGEGKRGGDRAGGFRYGAVEPVFRLKLGEIVERIRALRRSCEDLMLPDLSDPLNRRLLATYNSFLPPERWGYDLQQRSDPRGVLAEFIKTHGAGQIFVSTTKPGIVRGNHYHDTKVEKFLVLSGEAEIRFRMIGRGGGDDVIRIRVSGSDLRVVDIPPGYTHCIQNVGDTDMITLFWASEVFDPARPDTVFEDVDHG